MTDDKRIKETLHSWFFSSLEALIDFFSSYLLAIPEANNFSSDWPFSQQIYNNPRNQRFFGSKESQCFAGWQDSLWFQ